MGKGWYVQDRVHSDSLSPRLGYMIIYLRSPFKYRTVIMSIIECSILISSQKCAPLTVFSISVTIIQPVSQIKNLESFLSLFSASFFKYHPSGHVGFTSNRWLTHLLSVHLYCHHSRPSKHYFSSRPLYFFFLTAPQIYSKCMRRAVSDF